MSTDPKYYSEDVKSIVNVDFCIFTNKEVKKYSAVSNDPFGINLPESYQNYEPIKGGLVDLRLGTCDIYLPCTTCGENANDCPGHFGHTELAEYVFHYGFLSHLKATLQCICLQCSKVLIERLDSVFKKLVNKKCESRFREIKLLTKNINFCPNCGTPVGKIKKEEKESAASLKLILERESTSNVIDEKTGEASDQVKKILRVLTPRDCYNILSNLSDTECFLLGFNPKIQRPEDLILTRFPIPPVMIRPTAKIDFMQSSTMEDSLTLKIADIINSNKRVRAQMDKETSNAEISTYSQDIINLLQLHIVQYFDNETISLPKSEFKTGGRPTKSISERIKSKQGRVRSNLMGKRVDFSARSVITSDPYIDIDQVGIPKKIAMELTVPEEVTPFNIKHLSELVKNGRDEYPGANIVLRTVYRDGKPEVLKMDLKYRKKAIRLNIGDVVERHAVNDDWVLFNRQPTLHKPSMMGHRAQVIDREDCNTLRVNVSVCGPYNADFDGDEMNIHIAQSIQARNELKRIANVSLQIIGAKDSNPIIGCVQDALSGAYLLTLPDVRIKGSDVANFLCNTTSEYKFEIDKNKIYTGHDIFSYIIPKGINNLRMKDGKKIFEIVDGKLTVGRLDKSTLSKVKNSIIHIIWDKYGPNKTRKFIDDSQKLVLAFLAHRGFTIGFGDSISTNKVYDLVNQMANNKINEYNVLLTQYENDIDQLDPVNVEDILKSDLNAFSVDIGNTVTKTLDNTNNLFVMINSKSKGSIMNVQHMMCCVGQKTVEGSRIKKKIENRTLPIFHKDDDTPEARGFIKSSFVQGVNSYEFFYDAMAGREGLIDTAIKTAKTGYIQRQLIKGLEDLSIKYDMTNRNSKNVIIQYIYGENGIEQSKQSQLMIEMLAMNNKQVTEAYGFTSDEISKMEKKLKLKNLSKLNKEYIEKIKSFRDKLRIIQQVANNNYKVLEEKYFLPINLIRIVQDYSNNNENIELSPTYILDSIEELLTCNETRLLPSLKPTDKYLLHDDRSLKYLLEIALHDYLCPKKCIFKYGLSKSQFDTIIKDIKLNFVKALVEPGEMVGIISAQSIGEPCSQMSILGPTKIKIVTKNKNTNMISMITTEIGSLCDTIIKENPKLTFDTGHIDSVETEIESLENEYYIIGVDNKEKTHWNKISHVSRHPVNGQLVKVKTRSGRTVETTLSHSHLIRSDQTVKPILGADLKVGMRIPAAKHIDNTFVQENIEIDSNIYKLDYLFGWFIGAYLAEGNLTTLQNKLTGTISISNISKQFIDNTTQFAKLFDKKVTVRNFQGAFGPSTSTSFNYKVLATIINETCNTGSFNKKVPDFAFLAPNEFKAGLIQAYFDGDGNFNNHGSRNNIRVCSRSEQLIKDIALLLNYFDIFGHLRYDLVKGSNMYELDISSKYGPLYKKYIGSLLHDNKLNDIINYTSRDNAHDLADNIDKINGLGHIIAKCGKELNLPGQSRNYGRWKKKESIGRRTLKKYIEIFEAHEDRKKIIDEITILNQAANSNVIWDEIINIEIYTPDQSEYVYDFTVPMNQTFMTDYGIIVHNTLNTKHSAGVASKSNVTGGVPRIEELLHYSKDIKTPQMKIFFNNDIANIKQKVNKISSYLKFLTIKELLDSAEIFYDNGLNNEISNKIKNDNVQNPFFINNQKTELSSMQLVFRIKLSIEKLHDKETTLLDIKTKFVSYWQKNFSNFKNLKKNEKEIFTKITRCCILSNNDKNNQIIHVRFNMSSFNYNILTDFLKIILDQIILKGINNISNISVENSKRLITDETTGEFKQNDEYIVFTSGINVEKIKYIKGINMARTSCNDIATIYRLYGVEAARQILLNEFMSTFNSASVDINHNHMSVLIDMMTHTGTIISIDRHGLGKLDSDVFTKASFEKTMDHFINAAIFNEKDSTNSVSSRILLGKVIPGGTGAFDLLLDSEKLENSEYTKDENGGRPTFALLEEESMFKDIIKYGFSKNDIFIPVH
jgi:DNA-directed RNA polymerase II subunit RPB1